MGQHGARDPIVGRAGPGTIDVSILAGELRVCGWLLPIDHRQGAIGLLRGAGAGFTETRHAEGLWIAAALEIAAAGCLVGPLAWTVAGGGWIPLRSHGFLVEQRGAGGEVGSYENAALAGFLRGGLRATFF